MTGTQTVSQDSNASNASVWRRFPDVPMAAEKERITAIDLKRRKIFFILPTTLFYQRRSDTFDLIPEYSSVSVKVIVIKTASASED